MDVILHDLTPELWIRNVEKGGEMLDARLFLKFLFVFILVFMTFISGCGMDDPLIKEMEAAYQLPAQSHAEANKNVSNVMQKRFPLDGNVSEVLKELHEYEFKVIENRLEGWRSWPDGAIKPYANEIKNNIRIQQGQVNYLASKNYDQGILKSKRAVITIESDGKNITALKAAIYIDTL